MPAVTDGCIFETEFEGSEQIVIYFPKKIASAFGFAIECSRGSKGYFTAYELASFMNSKKYPALDPENNWMKLSKDEKDLIKQGEIDALKVISKITSMFIEQIEKEKNLGKRNLNNIFKPIPFSRYNDPSLMFEMFTVYDGLKILNSYQANIGIKT